MAFQSLVMVHQGCSIKDNADETLIFEVPAIKGKIQSVTISYTLSGDSHAGYNNQFELYVDTLTYYDLMDYGNRTVVLPNQFWWDFTKPKTLRFECHADPLSTLNVTNLRIVISYEANRTLTKVDGKWVMVDTYTNVNGTWFPVVEHYKINDQWQN